MQSVLLPYSSLQFKQNNTTIFFGLVFCGIDCLRAMPHYTCVCHIKRQYYCVFRHILFNELHCSRKITLFMTTII
jgi:hypothetical protein